MNGFNGEICIAKRGQKFYDFERFFGLYTSQRLGPPCLSICGSHLLDLLCRLLFLHWIVALETSRSSLQSFARSHVNIKSKIQNLLHRVHLPKFHEDHFEFKLGPPTKKKPKNLHTHKTTTNSKRLFAMKFTESQPT